MYGVDFPVVIYKLTVHVGLMKPGHCIEVPWLHWLYRVLYNVLNCYYTIYRSHAGQYTVRWNRVRSSCFKNYLGLTQIGSHAMQNWELSDMEYNDAYERSSWVLPTFVIILWCLLVHRSHTPVFMHIYLQNPIVYRLHRATPISQLQLQPQECYSCTMTFMWECCCANNVH